MSTIFTLSVIIVAAASSKEVPGDAKSNLSPCDPKYEIPETLEPSNGYWTPGDDTMASH